MNKASKVFELFVIINIVVCEMCWEGHNTCHCDYLVNQYFNKSFYKVVLMLKNFQTIHPPLTLPFFFPFIQLSKNKKGGGEGREASS